MSSIPNLPLSNYLGSVYALYYQFLGYFPESWHGIISLILAGLLVYAIFKVIKRNFIFIILLVLLLPQAAPMLKSIWDNLMQILQFLVNK